MKHSLPAYLAITYLFSRRVPSPINCVSVAVIGDNLYPVLLSLAIIYRRFR
jgi:hypothetical protein